MILAHNDAIDNWTSIRGTCRHLKILTEADFIHREQKNFPQGGLLFSDWSDIQYRFVFSHTSPEDTAVAVFKLEQDVSPINRQSIHRLARSAGNIRQYAEKKIRAQELRLDYDYELLHQSLVVCRRILCLSLLSPLFGFRVDAYKKEVELQWMPMLVGILVYDRWMRRFLEKIM